VHREYQPLREHAGEDPVTRARIAHWLLLALINGGCMIVSALTPEPGADTSVLQSGTARASVDAALGKPLREWTAPNGEQYALYEYDAGHAPDWYGAFAAADIDVATLGAMELLALGVRAYARTNATPDGAARIPENPIKPTHKSERRIVIYDTTGAVRAVTKEFDAAPPVPAAAEDTRAPATTAIK
jgi:hypothetical protein